MKSIRRPDDGNSFQSKITSYSLSDDDNVNAQSREIVQLPDNGRSLPEFDTKKPGRQSESSRQSFDEGSNRDGKHFESKIIFVLSSFSLLLLSLRSGIPLADNHFSHSSRKGLPEFASSFLESLDGGNRGNRSDAKRNGTLPLRLNTII